MLKKEILDAIKKQANRRLGLKDLPSLEKSQCETILLLLQEIEKLEIKLAARIPGGGV